MRLALLLLATGCSAPATSVPVEPAAVHPIDAAPIAAPAPVSPIETVDGETSTPGRHPRIPRGPSTNDLDRAAIRRTIRQRMAPVAACYEQLSPADRRRVVIQFTIGPTGVVLGSSASGPQGTLENCIASAFAGLIFDPPANGGTLTVSYPLQFRPG